MNNMLIWCWDAGASLRPAASDIISQLQEMGARSWVKDKKEWKSWTNQECVCLKNHRPHLQQWNGKCTSVFRCKCQKNKSCYCITIVYYYHQKRPSNQDKNYLWIWNKLTLTIIVLYCFSRVKIKWCKLNHPNNWKTFTLCLSRTFA